MSHSVASSRVSLSHSTQASVVSSASSQGSVVSAWTQRRRKRRRYRQKLSNIIKCTSCCLLLFFSGSNIYFLTKNTDEGILSVSSWKTLLSPNNSTMASTIVRKKTLLHMITNKTWHPITRRERFPSIQERVHRYMSIWYQPHACKLRMSIETKEGTPTLYLQGKTFYGGIVEFDTPLLLKAGTCSSVFGTSMKVMKSVSSTFGRIKNAATITASENNDNYHLLQSYCKAVQRDSEILFANVDIPILVQFHGYYDESNVDTSNGVPMLAKWRTSSTGLPPLLEDPSACQVPFLPTARSNMKPIYPPILWHFEIGSFSPERIFRADTPWNAKTDKAAGFGIGIDYPFEKKKFENLGTESVCHNLRHPCTFVSHEILGADNFNSTDKILFDEIVDLRVRPKNQSQPLSSESNAYRISHNIIQLRDWLRHKMLISLGPHHEKDDDLVWKLASSSVLLMPVPTSTSWIMEESLIPWVHYVPLNVTRKTITIGSKSGKISGNAFNQTKQAKQRQKTFQHTTYYHNILDMVQWVRDHDDEARKIAERATLFVYDLWYHPDAMRDNNAIKKEIMRRYQKYWR